VAQAATAAQSVTEVRSGVVQIAARSNDKASCLAADCAVGTVGELCIAAFGLAVPCTVVAADGQDEAVSLAFAAPVALRAGTIRRTAARGMSDGWNGGAAIGCGRVPDPFPSDWMWHTHSLAIPAGEPVIRDILLKSSC
jgi:hypothetical protein